MDPVSASGLAATAAQLLNLTFEIFVNIHKYYRIVRDAPRRSAELRMELDSLVDILSIAQQSLESHEIEAINSIAADTLSKLHELLKHLYSRIIPDNASGFQRLRWPFRQTENEEIVSKLQRYKINLTIALGLSHMSGTLLICLPDC